MEAVYADFGCALSACIAEGECKIGFRPAVPDGQRRAGVTGEHVVPAHYPDVGVQAAQADKMWRFQLPHFNESLPTSQSCFLPKKEQ